MAASKGILPETKPIDAQRAELASVLPARASNAIQQERLKAMQDALLEKSLAVVDATANFAEISQDAIAPPPEWVERYGNEEAMRRFRVAKAGWQPAAQAPIGIKVAASVAVGIMKARATEDAGTRTLNVAVLNWTGPLPQFVEQDYETE